MVFNVLFWGHTKLSPGVTFGFDLKVIFVDIGGADVMLGSNQGKPYARQALYPHLISVLPATFFL